MSSCELGEISKNTFFYKTLLVDASESGGPGPEKTSSKEQKTFYERKKPQTNSISWFFCEFVKWKRIALSYGKLIMTN